ncbi:MAG: hypothetical protein Q4G69_10085 [Planctomycetia bacterium]|nr:hypothetical protein [Planctomycetia bacterium]
MKINLIFIRSAVLCVIVFLLFGFDLQAADSKTRSKSAEPTRPVPPPFEERLFQDWLKQDSFNNPRSCFVDSVGNSTESKLIDQVLKSIEPEKRIPFEKERQDLLSHRLPGSDPKWRAFYEKLCRTRRTERLNMIAEFSPVWIYTKHYVIGASFYAYTEDASDEEYKDFSRDRRNGGQLCKMEILPDGQIKHEILYEVKEGTIRDPDVSWDGKKILFSMRRHFTKDDFHLYEYDVASKKLRQLTFGKGFADIEPVYLPNGDILFTSTRCVQITDCWWTEVSNFFMIDSEGRSMRRVSFDQVSVNYPKVLNDGRVIYTRWDYNDRGQVFPQPMFVMNSDATGQTEYYGNNSWFPTSIMHGRPIPDSSKVIAIAAGHHTYQHGKLLLIDRSKGNQENQGCTLIAPVRDTPAEKIDAYGQTGELFQYPYAMDESNFLVTYLPEGRWRGIYPIPFGIYFMNADGQRELLAYDPAISCNQQVPLMVREKPAVRVSQVDPKKKTGEFYVHNIYEGPGLKGIPKGTVKSLRVVALGFRPAGIQANGNSGPAGGAMSCTPVSINNGAWDTKHVLGTVPIEEDGSAYFRVPALTPVYFQLLDDKGDTVQTMRSWSTLQPGEFFACVGCHEPKANTVINFGSLSSKALRNPPVDIRQKDLPKGIFQDGFSFNREIQPILDDHCIECHTGGKKKDGSPAPFSLLGNDYRINDQSNGAVKVPGGPHPYPKGGRRFSQAYMNLTQCGKHVNQYIHWLGVQEGPQLLPPYFAGSALSPMMKMLRSGGDSNHKEVRISDQELRTIALWIDLLIPFCGDYKEAANWTPREKAVYAYYEMKRKEMNRIIASNQDRVENGRLANRLPDLKDLEQFKTGGPEYKAKFIDDYLKRSFPIIGKKSGPENIRRNLAVNPNDTQGELQSYPHASANSEFRYLRTSAAINAIDGKFSKAGSEQTEESIPAWRPDLRTDLQFTIEFGQNIETDQIVLQLDADFKNGPFWTQGELLFSDGSRERIEFKPNSDPQTIRFAKRKTSSVRLIDLQYAPDRKGISGNKYRPGIVEFEVWGKYSEE